MDNVIALGMTGDQWKSLMDTDEACEAEKAINYLDGNQVEEMEDFLDSPAGRKDWKKRGYVPRFRNITASIVEKSCRLFVKSQPVLNVLDNNGINETMTQNLNDLLYRSDFGEVCNNLDLVVRLLKTGILLVQWDQEHQLPVFEILHRGNCGIVVDQLRTIQGLIYQTSETDEYETYRIYTVDQIIDLVEAEDENEKFKVSGVQPNPYGMVPAAIFYDTKSPRCGVWQVPGMDLISANESLNIHLTDNDQIMSWLKRPTLYTNASFQESDTYEAVQVYGSPLPRYQPQANSPIAGPDQVIQIETQGVDNPIVEFKTPQVDLKPLDDIMLNLIKGVASDWSVNLKMSGSGSATSGFQLVVEEIDNLELRNQRQRQFEFGFRRLFEVLRVVFNYPNTMFDSATDVDVKFQVPQLPVDPLADLNVLAKKLELGLISRTQYFIGQGMTPEEAKAHVLQIDSERAQGL